MSNIQRIIFGTKNEFYMMPTRIHFYHVGSMKNFFGVTSKIDS
jgi:hypothetical protein